MKLNQRQTNKLLRIATVLATKFFYPDAPSNEDKRINKILMKIRTAHARQIVLRTLGVKQ